MNTRSLDSTDVAAAIAASGDGKVVGNGNLFGLIGSKTADNNNGVMFSQKGLVIPGLGVLVQQTAEFRGHQTITLSESLVFVPNYHVEGEISGLTGRTLVAGVAPAEEDKEGIEDNGGDVILTSFISAKLGLLKQATANYYTDGVKVVVTSVFTKNGKVIARAEAKAFVLGAKIVPDQDGGHKLAKA